MRMYTTVQQAASSVAAAAAAATEGWAAVLDVEKPRQDFCVLSGIVLGWLFGRGAKWQ